MTGQQNYGFVEWFRPGDHARVEEVLPGLEASGAAWLRTHLSWADFHEEGGEAWFDWLLPKLGSRMELLPCVHYTPPSMSRNGRSSGAPHDLKAYADFIDYALTRWGKHFSHVELWNEPNNLLDWDWRIDPEADLFCEMVGAAAYWVKERGWKTVLGGPSPFDAYWLNLMGERGLLELMDAVGIHGFPGTWDSDAGSWTGWDHQMSETRKVLERWNPGAEIWITETGYSTWRHDELEQANRFLEALDVGADRLYWYGWRDLPRDVAIQEGYWFDARHYHLGAVDSANNPKLLARLLSEGGIDRLREVTRLAAPAIGKTSRPVVITGGSGFIGSNLAESFLAEGREVAVLDNLSRPGVEQNLEWLRERHGDRVHPLAVDLRDAQTTRDALTEAESVFHLAAQTAVTTSLTNPMDDFQVNAAGTLHVLEGVRAAMEAQGRKIPLVFASTNKVYGALEDISMEEGEDRYLPADPEIRAKGIGEWRPLDFCTPYGCSKGVADQYVLDYAKSYGVPAAVLRMSCVYGPRQFGTEDQGWVAHFLIRALENKPISIYGDGKQVRDVLHVDDAVVAYRTVLSNISALSGAVFNLGGGPENAVSLRLVLGEMERLVNRPLDVSYNPWRQGDQPYFVADCSKLTDRTGWRARIGWEEGLQDLASWLRRNRDLPAAAQPERSQRAYA